MRLNIGTTTNRVVTFPMVLGSVCPICGCERTKVGSNHLFWGHDLEVTGLNKANELFITYKTRVIR